VVRLNRAVAIAEAGDPVAALAIVDGLDLPGYQYWHSTRAELLRRLGRTAEARPLTARRSRWPAPSPTAASSNAGSRDLRAQRAVPSEVTRSSCR
jgi:Predicted RNA polymerase sigma factor containing a TPR repeat domain